MICLKCDSDKDVPMKYTKTAWICRWCGAEYMDSEQMDKALEKTKKLREDGLD